MLWLYLTKEQKFLLCKLSSWWICYTLRYGICTKDGQLIDPTIAGVQLDTTNNRYHPVGLIYYQAGIVVLSGSVFNSENTGGLLNNISGSCEFFDSGGTLAKATSSFSQMTDQFTIKTIGNNFRNRLANISFNNTTELNSTIYFCRANHNEFNYSTNPTYLSSSQIIVKDQNPTNDPVSYITTIGLYSPNNELMGVAKLSEPLKKTPSQEFTLRVRLDY